MADLYNLLADDALLRENGEGGNAEEELEDDIDVHDRIGEDWDRDDREHIELSPPERSTTITTGSRTTLSLADSTSTPTTGGTPTSILDLKDIDDREPLELKDLQRDDPDELYQRYHKFQALWIQELASPELLPYDTDIIASMVDAVADQDDAAAAVAVGTGDAATGYPHLDGLLASVLRVDSGRCKFVLCHLLRERMRKLESYPRHHQQRMIDRMSPNELEFLKQYLSLVDGHLHRTVLDHFPQEAWKKLDAPEMIDEPDLDAYVFVRTKERVIVDRDAIDDEDPHEKGTCLIVRYARVRDLFLQDKVELLL